MKFVEKPTPATVELAAFKLDPMGYGRAFHGKRAAKLLYGDAFQWHEESERLFDGFSENKWTTVTGPGASGKTTTAAVYAKNFFNCAPHETGVLLTSTTLDGLKKRILGEVVNFHRIDGVGSYTYSDKAIRYRKGDDKHGIFGIAVGQGETEKALGKIIGFHPRRLLVVVDEMTDTPEAIVEACVNLQSGVDEFQFIGLGNAASRLDPHGLMCEPKNGWESVDVSTESWETKRGICIHQDGPKLPNVVAGRKLYRGLLTKEDLQDTKDHYGEDSPQYWRFRRGFWAPEGVAKTVLSEPLIIKHKARDKAIWRNTPKMCAGLDPAFEGGDRCVLQFGKRGQFDTGQVGVEYGERLIIAASASSKEPLHFQIARQTMEACKARNVDITEFAMDTTGEGGGLASIITQIWGDGFHRVEFGGRPSNMPVTPDRAKPAHEEYTHRVAELWYSMRFSVMQDRIRGLSNEAATEFCMRLYDMRGNKIGVEPKKDMKARTGGKSPDTADACTVVLDLCRNRGMSTGVRKDRTQQTEFFRKLAEFDVDSRVDYAA